MERGRDVIGINIGGLANVLELARIAGVRRFVYVSSGAAYGLAAGTDQTYSEDMPAAPDSIYGITKYAGELITRRYGELYGFEQVSVRLSTPYGPMERVTGHRAVMSALYQWTGQVARGEPLSVQADSFAPDDGRDYTYAVDTARGLQAILDAPELSHDLYNLTTGVWITYREILDALAEIAPGSAPSAAAGIAGRNEPGAGVGVRPGAAVGPPALAGHPVAAAVRPARWHRRLPAMAAGVGVQQLTPKSPPPQGEG